MIVQRQKRRNNLGNEERYQKPVERSFLYSELFLHDHFTQPCRHNDDGKCKSDPHLIKFKKFRSAADKHDRHEEEDCVKRKRDNFVAEFNKIHGNECLMLKGNKHQPKLQSSRF